MGNELSSILSNYAEASKRGLRAALATVTEVAGSSYRRPGARMLILEDGSVFGCVSGGCLERDLIRRAGALERDGQGELLRYDTSAEELEGDAEGRSPLPRPGGAGLGCDGRIDVWLERLPSDGSHELLGRLGRWRQARTSGAVALVTQIGSGETSSAGRFREGAAFFLEGETASSHVAISDLPPSLEALLRQAKAPVGLEVQIAEGVRVRILIEPFRPATPWIIIGAGHDSVPMARMGLELGWEVTVVDCHSSLPMPRRSFSGVENFIQCSPAQASGAARIDSRTCVILMTHNYEHDLEILPGLLASPARYVGMLGPRTRALKMLAQLRERGLEFSQTALDRLHAPVGLDLGAETPEEIALSAIAEVKAVLGLRPGTPLRDRAGPIHERAGR